MNELQWAKWNTLLYKNISLSFYSQFVLSLKDRWKDIYSERGHLLVPYLLPGARGCQCLQPFASRSVRDDTNASDWLRIPGLTFDSHWTDCLNLTMRFSYHVVSFQLHTCSTCLLITTWQFVKAHGVTRNESKIHVNSHYITLANGRILSKVQLVWMQSFPSPKLVY